MVDKKIYEHLKRLDEIIISWGFEIVEIKPIEQKDKILDRVRKFKNNLLKRASI